MTTARRIAITTAAIALALAGLLAVFAAGSAGAQGATAPHCARTQELCNVVEYVTVQRNGTHKVWTCFLTNPAYKPGPVSIRIAVYTCRQP